jgi:hypothetical protein
MKLPFGAKLARSSMRSMLWIAANHKNEGAALVSMLGQNCRPPKVTIVEYRAVAQVYGPLTKPKAVRTIPAGNEDHGT